MEIKTYTIQDSEEYLRQKSKEVDFNDKSYLADIKLLDEYCRNRDVFAMASVQIGIPKRIIYLKNTRLDKIECSDYNENRVLINPVIIKREGLTHYWENCASCMDNMGLVLRPYQIEVEYYDIEGNLKREKFEGFESTVLSHEYDHLDGILHIDIALEIKVMPKEERKIYRQTHGYKIYSKRGNYEELLKKELKKNSLLK